MSMTPQEEVEMRKWFVANNRPVKRWLKWFRSLFSDTPKEFVCRPCRVRVDRGESDDDKRAMRRAMRDHRGCR